MWPSFWYFTVSCLMTVPQITKGPPRKAAITAPMPKPASPRTDACPSNNSQRCQSVPPSRSSQTGTNASPAP